MSSRKLLLRVLNFEDNTRTLKWEFGFWGGTLERWYKEGLPKNIGFKRKIIYGEFINGPSIQYPAPSLTDDAFALIADDIISYFHLDKGLSAFPFNWFYYPRFEEKIIKETKDKIEYIDNFGIRSLKYKDDRCMPQWLDHPIKNESDWEEISRHRLNLDNFNKRYTCENIDKFISDTKNRDYPLILYGTPIGFFGILRFLIGEENLYYWYYDKPSLIKRILDYLCSFWLNIAEELTSKIEFDDARFFEDMAYRGGSLVSPSIFKEFMSPYYKKLTDFAKSKGIKHFIVDSDGYIEKLIPLFREVGITGFQPFEIRAGNDIERVRKMYPKVEIFGGVDKNALENKEKIDKELDKVVKMIKKGGYIPHIDHAVPPNVSWDNFKYYREKLNSIIDTIKVKV